MTEQTVETAEEQPERQPHDHSAAINLILTNIKGAKDRGAAVGVLLDGILNEARVYREDGPALEDFCNQLDEQKGAVAAAIGAHH